MGNFLKGLVESLSSGLSISDVISGTENLISQFASETDKIEYLNSDLAESEDEYDYNSPIYYEAKSRETIYSICHSFKITESDFRKWNNLGTNDTIKKGVKYIVGYNKNATASKAMNQVIVTITNKKVGYTKINSYPDVSLLFRVPLYEVRVEAFDSGNKKNIETFKAVRFGIAYRYKGGYEKPGWTGFTENHRFVVYDWNPEYLTGNSKNLPKGAFAVYKSFLIHTGARDTTKYTVGSIGCVEIEGNGAWENFVKTLKEFANAPSEDALIKAKKMIVIYEQESYPKMEQIGN